MAQPSLQQARDAKRDLEKRIADRAWFRGIGLSRDESGWMIRLNVARSALEPGDSPPREHDGIPVQVVFIEGYRRR